jgi:SAM-dependent methyltransferase
MESRKESNNVDLFITNNGASNASDIDSDTIQNRYWAPNSTIIEMIENQCETNAYSKILEIGPGRVPFKLASDFIGCNERIMNCIEIDIDKTRFPYDDADFDFIYCRHVLEDIQNPDFALNEMFRVSKFGGYIETPSPLIEAMKDVDAYTGSDKYCGYMHHRYIVWSNIQKNEIYFLPKYNCVLDHFLKFEDDSKDHLYNLINNYPVYWNNYFLYDINKKPTIVMYKNGVNFGNKGSMVEEYIQLVVRAINESIKNTEYFVQTYR